MTNRQIINTFAETVRLITLGLQRRSAHVASHGKPAKGKRSWVFGNALVYGDARVSGNARVKRGVYTSTPTSMTKEQYADLNATIFDFQKKIMMHDIASMDPEVRATMEAVEAQLDALRAGKLFQLR